MVRDIQAKVVPKINDMIQRAPVHSDPLQRSISLLTLSNELEVYTVELLIGNDYFSDLILPERKKVIPDLYLLGSHLGLILSGRLPTCLNLIWVILSGRLPTEERKTSEVSIFLMTGNSCQQYQQSSLLLWRTYPNLDMFWKLETIGIKEPINDCTDDQAIQNFHATIRKTSGRYEVTWPWKEENSQLPDNYQLALGRLNSLLKRIQGNPELLQMYDSIIKDQLKNQIIEEVEDRTEEERKKHYTPHHAVITPNRKATKVRIAYGASKKAKKRMQES